MSTRSKLGSRGASITPSARPSIHNHPGPCTSMGKVDLHTSPSKSSVTPHRDEGKDEVDNIMSKHARIPNASPDNRQEKKVSNRRFSYDDNLHSDHSSSECSPKILATSLPTIPTHFSEDIGHRNASSYSLSTSENSQYLPNSSNVSHNANNTQNQDRVRAESVPILENKPNSSGSFTAIVLIVAICVIAYFVKRLNGTQESGSVTKDYSQVQFSNDLYDLGEKYKIRQDSILQLKTGLFTISQRADAGSFIFVYNSRAHNFNAVEFNNFVNEVYSVTAKYLRNDSTSVQHVVIDGSKLEMNIKSHGDLISRYREDVGRTGVMLIKDLQKIPSSLAMAFHYYCDEYNPVAKKSAILFTLDLAKCNGVTGNVSPTHARIEECLANKWNGLPSDNMGPLLTRVVDIVVDVTRL